MARCRRLQGVDKPHNPPIRTLSIGEGTGGARRGALSVDGPSATCVPWTARRRGRPASSLHAMTMLRKGNCRGSTKDKRGEAWNPGSFGKDMACADREKDKIRTGQ